MPGGPIDSGGSLRAECYTEIVTSLDLTFIGTGNAFAPGGLCWNGFVVNERYLFEVPPTALMALNRVGIDANTLDAIVISHHHGDHFLGLPFLILHWKWMGRTRPVRIIGPAGTQRLAMEIGEMAFPGEFDLPFEIEWEVARPGVAMSVGELQLEPVEVKHDPLLNQSLGYAAAIGVRRFGYTGDSALCDGVLDLARRNEVLVSECSSRSARLEVDVHMNLVDDMPKVRAAMPPESKLLLTHLGPDVGPLPGVEFTITRDLERYCL